MFSYRGTGWILNGKSSYNTNVSSHEVRKATPHFGWCIRHIRHKLLCKIHVSTIHLSRNYSKTIFFNFFFFEKLVFANSVFYIKFPF